MEPEQLDNPLKRNVSVMAIGNTVSTSVNTLWIMFMPYFYVSTGFQEFTIGLIFSGVAIARAVNLLIGGRLADRFGRKPVMLLGLTIFGCGPFIIIIANLFLVSNPPLAGYLAVTGLGVGMIGSGLSRPASSMLLVESSPKKKRGLTYMVVSRVLPSIPPAVLIIVGWWMYASGLFWLALLVGTAGVLLVVLLFGVGLRESLDTQKKIEKPKTDLKTDSGLWLFILLAAAFALDGISSSGLSWYVPLFVVDGAVYSALIAVSTLVIAGAALMAGVMVDKVGTRSAIVIGWTVLAVTVALFPHAVLPLEMLVLYSIWAGLDMVDVSVPALVIAEEYPEEVRASVMGSFSMTVSILSTIGPALIAIALLLGDAVPFYLKAIMNLIGVGLFLLAFRNQKRDDK
ncbi:MAG: MFS transporter [Candidatus Thorarchaeota archaeon]